VKIAGAYSLPLPPEEAYHRLQDPRVLAACIPGCESLEKIAENEYQMSMKMALASLSGAFSGKVRIADQTATSSFKLIVEGTGKLGFMKGEGLLKFAAADAGSEVSYEGDVQVGGTLAAVGQRLIDASSKMLIRRFFDKVAEAG
jgi:hypothetical protein